MTPYRKFALALVLVAASLLRTAAGAADTPAAKTLTVFAAASLTESFKAIGAAYERSHPDTKVQFNFAGSSTLVQQIREGAPADVFASADEANMKKAVDAGDVAGSPRIFATNSLCIVAPSGNPHQIATLRDLTTGKLTLALAAPAVPAGRYAAEAFAKAGLSVPSASQEVDVRAVLNKVALDEVDAGIVYVTDVRAAGGRVEAVAIPDAQNVVAKYPIAVLKHAADATAAAVFVDLVLSDVGLRTLAEFGFRAP